MNAIHDPARLEALHESGLLHAPAGEALDRLTRLAVTFLGAALAQIHLVAEVTEAVASSAGAEGELEGAGLWLAAEVSRRAVEVRRPSIVRDRVEEPSWDGRREIEAWMVLPLVTADGHLVGAFCVADLRPRDWTAEEMRVLQDLTAAAATEVDLRRDLGKRRRVAETVERLSILDEVTGSYNRQGFFLFAEQHWRLARRHRGELLLLLLTVGAAVRLQRAGREEEAKSALAEAAGMLRRTVRDTDIVARVGEAELAVLGLEAGAEGARAIRARLDREVEERAARLGPGAPALDLRLAPPHIIRPPSPPRPPETADAAGEMAAAPT